MIIKRAFYREATLTSLAVGLVLGALFAILGLTKLLGQAAGGEHSSDVVFKLLGLELLGSLDILFPLALFVGVLLTVGRWYRDNEMTVLAASGIGLGSISRPLIQLALCFSILVAVLALYVSPWASTESEQIKNKAENETEISAIAPGVFIELRRSGRILYVEKIRRKAILENVFVSDSLSPTQNVLVASRGRQVTDSSTGEEFLVLENGSLYEGTAGEPDYRIVNFTSYTTRLEPKDATTQAPPLDGLPTSMLLGSGNRRHIAEWHWRLAKPISVLVLAIFAFVLAHTDARRGRVANFFAAILVYFIYTNLIGIGETLLKDGRVPLALGLWWVHAAVGIVGVYLLARRVQNKPLFSLPKLVRQ
ncbi:MAG: LPS export ABC transporter permease LptF [Acidiferrobacterales bacterium]